MAGVLSYFQGHQSPGMFGQFCAADPGTITSDENFRDIALAPGIQFWHKCTLGRIPVVANAK